MSKDKDNNLIPVDFKSGKVISQVYWDVTERVKNIKIDDEWFSYPLLCKRCGNPLTVGQSDMSRSMITMCLKCNKYRKYDVQPSET